MKKNDNWTWTHKGWLIIKASGEYRLWRQDDRDGRRERAVCPTLATAKYLIDQATTLEKAN
jgi:hypothetical protein